jgi:VWFA-related protein
MAREIIALCVALAFASAGPQDSSANIEPRVAARAAAATIRVDADLVLIPVSVTDNHDRQVPGLTRDQFLLFDDQVEQAITHFASVDAPISVAIVFDASGSMGSKLMKSREAVAAILPLANPDDEFALIQFNERVQRLVGFTTRTDAILGGLALTQAKGRTALLDAIYFAVDTMKQARNARKAIVILSDGGDNCSRYTLADTLGMVREADVQIYSIAAGIDIGSPAAYEEIAGSGLLQAIAEMTGGRMFLARRADDLRGIAARIGVMLRNQYMLGYSPSNLAADGRYHRVQVKVRGIEGARLSWRSGYRAPTE